MLAAVMLMGVAAFKTVNGYFYGRDEQKPLTVHVAVLKEDGPDGTAYFELRPDDAVSCTVIGPHSNPLVAFLEAHRDQRITLVAVGEP